MRLALLLLPAALLSCGPSSAEVRRARSAEYQEPGYPELVEIVRAAAASEGYALEVDDPDKGVFVSEWRWHTKEGAQKAKGYVKIEEGAAIFRVAIEIRPGGRKGWVVAVDGGAQGYTLGNPKPIVYEHGDPQEPHWVQGKIDGLVMAIWQRAKHLELPPPGKP